MSCWRTSAAQLGGVVLAMVSGMAVAPVASDPAEPPEMPQGAKSVFVSGVLWQRDRAEGLAARDAVRSPPEAPAKVRKEPPLIDPGHRQAGQLESERHSQAADGIRHWIELLPPNGQPAASQRVTENRIFRSGERIRLHFETNVAGYITLLAVGSSGREQVLFPQPQLGLVDNRLQALASKILPAENAWMRFDEQPGEERILVYFLPDRPVADRLPGAPVPSEEPQVLIAAAGSAAPRSEIERARGRKDFLIEADESGTAQTGVYRVRRATGEAIAYDIVLRHE